jgi:imidazole glycerol-phosphate synthase subunit HisH
MIAVIDYGAGNPASVLKALDHLGVSARICRTPDDVAAANALILPGVGHFASTASLSTSGLRDAIAQSLASGRPFLGICVGKQWLFEGSEEAPGVPGLGIFPGVCSRFPSSVKSPHVGWNSLDKLQPSWLLNGIAAGEYAYFTHSYRAPLISETVAATSYGDSFSSAVERDNIAAVQFHPEKSGPAGLRILRNFLLRAGEISC